MTKKFDRTIARTAILHYVLSFCITANWEPEEKYPRRTPGIEGFTPDGDKVTPQAGDLVLLQSAPASKWTIGWLRAVEEVGASRYDRRYLIESLEDGVLCWWGNVGLSVFPRHKISPRWSWTDGQYAFQKRLARLYRKMGDGKVNDCVFHPDGSVTIGVRGYWDFADLGDNKPQPIERTFPNWKKTTVVMLKAAIVEMDAALARRKE